ncbi:hypothetical protein MRX96_050098 [Rhipicephalus microplus]
MKRETVRVVPTSHCLRSGRQRDTVPCEFHVPGGAVVAADKAGDIAAGKDTLSRCRVSIDERQTTATTPPAPIRCHYVTARACACAQVSQRIGCQQMPCATHRIEPSPMAAFLCGSTERARESLDPSLVAEPRCRPTGEIRPHRNPSGWARSTSGCAPTLVVLTQFFYTALGGQRVTHALPLPPLSASAARPELIISRLGIREELAALPLENIASLPTSEASESVLPPATTSGVKHAIFCDLFIQLHMEGRHLLQ